MGVTPGKKSPKKSPKGKSPAVSEQMEITVTSPEKKTAVAATEKPVTPQSTSNGPDKKSDSKKKKSLKRKLDDDDYEEKTEEVKNSEAVISEDDLNALQKESSKKQKKKKQKVDKEEEDKSSDSAKKAGLTSGDEQGDEEGEAIPSNCKLFVTSLGLERMTKAELKDLFKSHGYNLVLAIKQFKSRHAFVGLATEEEAKKAKESLDKIDCKGFPLSIDSKELMLSSLRLTRRKPGSLINKDGTADCILYASPLTHEIAKPELMASFVGVVHVYYRKGKKGKPKWARLECINSTVAKELHKSHQGKIVEGTALRLETAEEFRRRIAEEEAVQVKEIKEQKKKEKMKKKQEQKKKQEKKSKPKPEESSSEKSDQSDSEEEEADDDVKVVNDDDDSEEEELPPKMKKAKVAGKR